MLSRTADNLYWMARYMERAENTARLLGGIYRMTLIPNPGRERQSHWEGLFQTQMEKDAFLERYEGFAAGPTLIYFLLDPQNPSSVRSCVWAARENVRATRHVLTTELWEAVNQTWLEIRDLTYDDIKEQGVYGFLDWVKERCHLARGIVHGTMRRGEALLFWRVGGYVERAENTSRLLLARAPSFHTARRREDAIDYYQWGTLLRSLNAFKTYREIFRGQIEPRSVAELLILHPDMPRSLRACFDEITEILTDLRREAPCTERAQQMLAQLKTERVDRIFRSGLDIFVTDFRADVHDLSTQIARDFMMIR